MQSIRIPAEKAQNRYIVCTGVHVLCPHIISTYTCIYIHAYALGAFYFLFGNLSPRLRSKISGIQLLLLAKYNLIAEPGIDRLLKSIVEDIRKLESVISFACICIPSVHTCTCACVYIMYMYIDYTGAHHQNCLQESGVPFVINGMTCYFHGTVTVVCADNPASASLGGFKQSGSAFRFCRHCMGTEADIQTKVISMCIVLLWYLHVTIKH